MPTYVNNKKIKKVFHGNTKIKKIYYGEKLVFTSGTAVSYYQGDRLLGTEDIEDGESVLSPSSNITSALSVDPNYSFVGWSDIPDGKTVKDLLNKSRTLVTLVMR